MTKSNH